MRQNINSPTNELRKNMHRSITRPPTIFVVDSKPVDYRVFAPMIEAGEVNIEFFTAGKQAIRAADHTVADLWMVNTDLPDMSGFDLLEMLEIFREGAGLYVVSEEYNEEDERQALNCGASQYVCKPPQIYWLGEWRRPRRPAHQKTYRRKLDEVRKKGERLLCQVVDTVAQWSGLYALLPELAVRRRLKKVSN